MIILGNLYNQDNTLWVIIVSSFEIDGYKYFKKTRVIDDIVIYQYRIEIIDKTKQIQVGDNTINIPNVKPQLNNTSMYLVSCDGQNHKKYNYSNPIKVYSVSDDTDMWKKLYMDIKADTNTHKYVIHIGDQVYMDDAHDELIKNGTTNDKDTVRRTYYDVYKQNYSTKYKNKVLKSAYNVMIGDDHDFIDNYGSVPNNLTPTMLRNVKKMYQIFQEDLYGVEEHDIKHLFFKDFQIIIPDLRKYRKPITDNTTEHPIMGQTQMTEFDNIVKNTKSNIKRTYYVSTTPLVGVNKTASMIYSILNGGQGDYHSDYYISSSTYTNEQKYVLGKLFELNNVVVICGDYHIADYYTFFKDGKCIKQITTSPISSDPLGIGSPLYIQALGWLLNKLIYDRTIDDIIIDKKWLVAFDYNYLKTTHKVALLSCYDESNSKSIEM